MKEITGAEYRARRERVLAGMGGAVGVVLAGEGAPPLHGTWQPDAHFAYLTGLTTEPGAAVLFDPRAEDPKRRCVLFLKPLNPEAEAWDGYREPLSGALRERCGFQTVLRTTMLPRVLTAAIRLRKKAACLHPLSVYDAPVSPDLALIRRVCERVPGAAVADHSSLLAGLRAVKSRGELALMRRAIDATAEGFGAMARALKPGARERDLQHAFERACAAAGAEGNAYNPIVGSGVNATVLHYNANSGTARTGELVVIDAGAKVGGYCADVTRTYPVGGRFTARQRRLYDAVLEAETVAIRAVRPGVWMHEVDEAARKVLRRAGLEDKYIHGIGHHLGMEVHDATPDGPLKPGMVVTVEPGVYLRDEGIGIRIEDDILVTRSGRENLTAMIEKDPVKIERMLSRRRR